MASAAVVPAVVGVDGTAVDARPLIAIGLLDRHLFGSTDGDPHWASRLAEAVGDERSYVALAGSVRYRAERLAGDLAADLDEHREPFDRAMADALRRWHLALARVYVTATSLELRQAEDVVLAPGRYEIDG